MAIPKIELADGLKNELATSSQLRSVLIIKLLYRHSSPDPESGKFNLKLTPDEIVKLIRQYMPEAVKYDGEDENGQPEVRTYDDDYILAAVKRALEWARNRYSTYSVEDLKKHPGVFDGFGTKKNAERLKGTEIVDKFRKKGVTSTAADKAFVAIGPDKYDDLDEYVEKNLGGTSGGRKKRSSKLDEGFDL